MKEYLENMDYNNLIQNLNGIGVFITSLITLFTLLVLMKQRKDSFRPRVIFGNRLSAVCKAKDSNILRTKWDDAYPEEGAKVIDFCFELLNVGVGIAENVTIKEYFDYKKAIKFIKSIDKENEFIFNHIDDMIEIRTTFDNSFTNIYLDKTPRKLGTFITRQQDKPQKYLFTDACLAFLSCFDYLRNKNDRFMNLNKYPSCFYKIQYSDIEGKTYKAKYECKVSSILMDDYTFTFTRK